MRCARVRLSRRRSRARFAPTSRWRYSSASAPTRCSACGGPIRWQRLVGADENSNRDVGVVINGLDEIRRRHGSAVLGVAHPGHDDKGRERGASALPAAADCRVMVSGSKALATDLTAVKIKDYDSADRITLHLEPVKRSLVVARVSTLREAKEDAWTDRIAAFLRASPSSSQAAVEKALGGNHDDLRDSLNRMVASGDVLASGAPTAGHPPGGATELCATVDPLDAGGTLVRGLAGRCPRAA